MIIIQHQAQFPIRSEKSDEIFFSFISLYVFLIYIPLYEAGLKIFCSQRDKTISGIILEISFGGTHTAMRNIRLKPTSRDHKALMFCIYNKVSALNEKPVNYHWTTQKILNNWPITFKSHWTTPNQTIGPKLEIQNRLERLESSSDSPQT